MDIETDLKKSYKAKLGTKSDKHNSLLQRTNPSNNLIAKQVICDSKDRLWSFKIIIEVKQLIKPSWSYGYQSAGYPSKMFNWRTWNSTELLFLLMTPTIEPSIMQISILWGL